MQVNPGAGPVPNATEANAVDNMPRFIADCSAKNLAFVRVPEQDDGDGRYSFLVYRESRCHLVQMPGLPLERVRFMTDQQNARDYPRLYRDGGSWLWKFALLDEEAFEVPSG